MSNDFFSKLGAMFGQLTKPQLNDVQKEVQDLRMKVKEGFNHKRGQLLNKLCDLAHMLAEEQKFKDTIDVLHEILDLGLILAGQDKTKDFSSTAMKLGQVIVATRFMEEDVPLNQLDEIFDIYNKWIAITPEQEFAKIKNEWSLTINTFAKHLLFRDQKDKSVELVESTLQKVESLHNPLSTNFLDWKALLIGYNMLARIYKSYSNVSTAIAYFLRYDEIADKAHDVIQRHKPNNPMPIHRNFDGGHILLGTTSVDLSVILASAGFEEERYLNVLEIGNLYDSIGHCDEAIKYYDKALRVANYININKSQENYGSIPVDMDPKYLAQIENAQIFIPIKKAAVYDKIEDGKNFVKNIQLAEKELQAKLKERNTKTKKDELDKLQSEINKLHNSYNKSSSVNNKTFSKKNSTKGVSKLQDGSNLHYELAKKNNDATGFMATAELEINRGAYKSAILYALKARNILDSLFMQLGLTLPPLSNLVYACYILTTAYIKLDNMNKAEKWADKAVKHVKELDEKIKDMKNKTNLSQQELSLLENFDNRNIWIQPLQNLVMVYITTGQFEEAIEPLIKIHNEYKSWIKELFVIEKLEGQNKQWYKGSFVEVVLGYIKVNQAIEECYSFIGNFEEAMKWSETAVKELNELCKFLYSYEEPACIFRSKADFSMAAIMVYTGKLEQADNLIKTIAQRFLDKGIDKLLDIAIERTRTFVALRLNMLISEKEFDDEREKLIEARKIMQDQKQEAGKMFNEVLEKLKIRRQEAENAHCVIRKQWDLLIKYTTAALDWCRDHNKEWNNMLLNKLDSKKISSEFAIEAINYDLELVISRNFDQNIDFDKKVAKEPTDIDIDKEIEEQDFDFEKPEHNPIAPEFEIMMRNATPQQRRDFEKFSSLMYPGDDSEDEDDEYQVKPKQNEKIRRNDPCPCGSGKKYKKCCMNKNN
ncbi:MAG: SEC-C domain-containing protein [Planctomycetaceae bacterium]|jgi:tetratricopeptide (TPR) repeat protein|nr:SEC-C domain-containing protein [Planctomycetaceae bacterium]